MTTINKKLPEDYYDRFHAAVKAWVQANCECDAVYWSHEEEKNFPTAKQWRLELTIQDDVDQGWDEIRRAYDEDNDTQTVSQVGIRLIRVQMKAESLMPSKRTAWQILMQIRNAYQGARLSQTKQLRDENISLNDIGNTVKLPTSYDSRMASAASFDVTFNVALVIPQRPEDFVEEVDIDGTFDS